MWPFGDVAGFKFGSIAVEALADFNLFVERHSYCQITEFNF